ncbi:PIR protein CIR protein [Plasmodium vinckei vinckei]|uniref:PIR protein CIR protein n=1 Tax=Plasmodium vinckei vinckei TaxID=54757 RepID=A0A449BXK3_PLAVN|nr:PIR protein CIR protein [Plasmodium vinckei vinckei]VEV58069.1 PIR protein CIR protein [Plasmodium vinckei vinckei]
MTTKRMCKLLLEGDSYFNDENVDTEEINKNTKIKGYCSSNGCETNEARINAVAKYIIMEFKSLIKRRSQYNHYDEYLLMWISDKLLKIHKKGKGQNIKMGYIDAFTLKQAYKEYLEKHKKGLDYWVLFDNIKGLKEANLWYMSEFYKLLNKICNTIAYYEKNNAESKKLSKYFNKCLIQYRTLHLNISKCKSYLDLLNKLKGIYDDFRDSPIKKNSSNINLATNLKKLTPKDGKEMKAVKGFKTYNFSNEECKLPSKKPTPRKASKLNPGPASNTKIQRESPDSQGVSNSTGGQLSNQGDTSKGSDNGSIGGSDGSQVIQEESEGSKSGQDVKDSEPGGSGSEAQGSDGEKTDTDNDPSNKGGPQGDQGDSLDGPGSGPGDKGSQGGSDIGPGASGSQSTSWLSFDIGSSFFEIVSKGMKQLNNALDFVEEKKEQLTKVTNTIKDFYSTSVSNIKTAYDNSRNFLNSIIVHISSQPEKLDISDKSGDDKLGSDGTGDGLPTPNGSSPSQTDSPQTPSGTPYSSLPSENPGTETKGNGITKIGDIYVLKEYKQIGISIIVLLIPITLAIMHKYLLSGWRKEMKRKKDMKKIINSIGGKRTVQIIISSSSHKKQIKKSISFGYKEKSPSLNIYKLMQADPVPFINLFFLLIFFVYKRKDDSLEL